MYLLALLIIVFTVWWVYSSGAEAAQKQIAKAQLAGYWTGDPGFMVTAGLNSMKILISPKRNDGSRLAHLSATNSKNETIADVFAIVNIASETGWRRWLPLTDGKKEKNWVRFPATFAAENNTLFPRQIDFLVDPTGGRLRIHGNKKVLAILDRDTASSAVLTAEPKT
jgi:hypothetical protein